MDHNNKTKVLVVEDDTNLRDILKSMCEKEGWTVIEAGDGEQAVAEHVANKPDIVLLDLLLPKLDGFGFLKTIRKHSDPIVAHVPVIVLSNLYSNEDILEAERLVIDAYFVKANVTLDAVMAKVREILKK